MRRKPLIEREKKRGVREENDLPNSHHIKKLVRIHILLVLFLLIDNSFFFTFKILVTPHHSVRISKLVLQMNFITE